MKKIILSNFLESKENYESFKNKCSISNINIINELDSIIFNHDLNIKDKATEVVETVLTYQNFTKLISILDYSSSERQMLSVYLDNIDSIEAKNYEEIKYHLVNDLTNDLTNAEWIWNFDISSKNNINDEIYQDLLNIDENQALMNWNDTAFDDFYEDKENKVIYFVIGNALISYSNETGGFNVMPISDYSDLRKFIETNATDKQPLVNIEFGNEFLSKVDTSNLSDFYDINSWIETWLIEGNNLWDTDTEVFNETQNTEDKLNSIVFINKNTDKKDISGSFYAEVNINGEEHEFQGFLYFIDYKTENIVPGYIMYDEDYELGSEETHNWFQQNKEEILIEAKKAFFNLEDFDANNIKNVSEEFVTHVNIWYAYSISLSNKWYNADEEQIKILDNYYPFKESFDDFLNQVVFNINNNTKYNIELTEKYWKEVNDTVQEIIKYQETQNFAITIQRFASDYEELVHYINDVESNKILMLENSEIIKLYSFVKNVICDDSVQTWVNWLRSNTDTDIFKN